MNMGTSSSAPMRGRFGMRRSEETKQKMSEVRIGEKHPLFGKHRSEETKKKISKSLCGNVPWNKGKSNIYSSDTIKKMSKSHIEKSITEEHRKNLSKAGKLRWKVRRILGE
jgi:hypothetical protein